MYYDRDYFTDLKPVILHKWITGNKFKKMLKINSMRFPLHNEISRLTYYYDLHDYINNSPLIFCAS